MPPGLAHAQVARLGRPASGRGHPRCDPGTTGAPPGRALQAQTRQATPMLPRAMHSPGFMGDAGIRRWAARQPRRGASRVPRPIRLARNGRNTSSASSTTAMLASEATQNTASQPPVAAFSTLANGTSKAAVPFAV